MAWLSAASQYELENNRNQEIFDSDTEHEKKDKKNNIWAQTHLFPSHGWQEYTFCLVSWTIFSPSLEIEILLY